MPTTTTIRNWWDPACEGPFVKIAIYGDGVVAVDPAISEAVHALSACLEAASYESRKDDTGAYNCRRITGGTRYSLHAYGIAVDINWTTNPYGDALVTDMPASMVTAIKRIRTVNGKQVWRWGGDYAGNKDAMHFEVVAHPSDLTTGIDPATLPQPKPSPNPPPQQEDDLVYRLAWIKGKDKPGALYRVLFANAKDGLVAVEAYDVPSDPKTIERWRDRLEEVPSSKPLPANTFIRIMDGPYKNVS